MQNALTDANQKAMVKLLRELGYSVQLLSAVGKGVPDLLIGHKGVNYLMEIKNGPKAKLTGPQPEWHRKWQGQVIVIHNMKELTDFMVFMNDNDDWAPTK